MLVKYQANNCFPWETKSETGCSASKFDGRREMAMLEGEKSVGLSLPFVKDSDGSCDSVAGIWQLQLSLVNFWFQHWGEISNREGTQLTIIICAFSGKLPAADSRRYTLVKMTTGKGKHLARVQLTIPVQFSRHLPSLTPPPHNPL